MATIKNNIVKNCTDGGIMTLAANQYNFIIEGNICYDDQGTPTQSYGIRITGTGTHDYIIKDNICFANTIAQISDLGTGANRVVAE